MAIEEKNKSVLPIKKKEQVSIDSSVKFLNVHGQVIHIKIGDDNNRMGEKEISVMQSYIQNKFIQKGINSVILVTHHLCDIKILETVNPITPTIKEKNEGLAN